MNDDVHIDKSIFFKKNYAETTKLFENFPVFSIIELNIYGACNRSCSFCPVSNPNVYTNVHEGISKSTFDKILQDLCKIDYSGTMLISAFSEPFLHKNLNHLLKIILDT